MIEDDLENTRGAVFLRALRNSFARPPLWILCWGVLLLASIPAAVSWQSWFAGTLEHTYEPGSVLAMMDGDFRQDHAEELGVLRSEGARAALPVALFAMLFGVFAAGGWLQVFLERTSGHSVRRFLWGGARYFWRFARVWILSLLLIAFSSWVLYSWPWKTLLELLFQAEDGNLEVLTSELSAVRIGWLQAGLFAFLFAMVLVWGDYTRTRMALHNSRSALWAGICTAVMILVHPVRTLRPFTLLILLEIGVVTGLGALSWKWNTGLEPDSGWGALVALFLLGQAAMLWQTISRAARYSAAVQVSRAVVPPPPQPDPWASRIGPPGGPQYPIDVTDDYGVSI